MKLKRKLFNIFLAAMVACIPLSQVAFAAENSENDGMNMYENSDFIEKEQPALSEETKQLISLYQKDPTDENYMNLREKVIEDYNAVVERKETKLSELKAETEGKPGGEAIVAEMEDLVQDIYITYWDRINSSMLRFTDPRLLEEDCGCTPARIYPRHGRRREYLCKARPSCQRRICGIFERDRLSRTL